MSTVELREELVNWISGSESRFAIMVKEAPIGESTLRAIIAGRYNPAERLAKAILGVIKEHRVSSREKAAV